jgi:hypothetical protein
MLLIQLIGWKLNVLNWTIKLNGMFSFLQQKKELNYKVSENYNEIIANVKLQGFAIIRICDAEALREFKKLSFDLIKMVPESELKQFLALGRISDSNIRNKSTGLIQKYIIQYLCSYFNEMDFDFISGVHLLKPTGKNGILNPHQDSTLVDEDLFDSFYFWMPISEIDGKSGTLEIIPKSHLLEIPYRSLNIPWNLQSKVSFLWKYMKKILVPPGHAIIFHSRLVHGSGANNSNQLRIAINSFIKPKQADLLHYYSDKLSDYKKIEIFKINPNFYYEENIIERPSEKYELYKIVENCNRKYNENRLKEIFLP